MANPQPLSVAYQPGRTIYVILWDLLANKIWNTVTPGWETYSAGSIANYKISLTDINGIGWYTAPYPTAITNVAVTQVAYDSENTTSPIGANLVDVNPASSATPLDSGAAVVAIVNRALSQLGVTNIVDLDEDSEAANRANAIFDTTRDSLLRACYWQFASYTDTLALLANETNIQWSYLYAYPPKALMIRKIFDSSCANPGGDLIADAFFFGDLWLFYHPEFRYKEMISPTTFTKSIACNINPAYIEYTYQITDPNQWDNLFVDAMVYALASELAHPLTGNTGLQDKMEKKFQITLTEAKRINGQEDNSTKRQESSYQKARM